MWASLTDLPSWPRWNWLIPRVDGSLAPGSDITLFIRDDSGQARPFKARVADTRHDRRLLAFDACLAPKWALNMTHTFAVEPAARARSRLRQRWAVTGLLTRPLWTSLRRDMTRFSRIAEDLGAAHAFEIRTA